MRPRDSGPAPTTKRGFTSSASGFGGDRRGAVLVYVAILLPILVGMFVIAVGFSQGFWKQAEYQRAADSLARAAAAELDGRIDAESRAAAAANALGGSVRFTQPVCWLLSFHVLYSESWGDIARSVTVEVRAGSAGDACGSGPLRATATAQFGPGVCRAAPLMVCNPYEANGASIFDVAAQSFAPGSQGGMRQWRLRPASSSSPDPSSPWAVYGLLDPRGVGGEGLCRTDSESIDTNMLMDGVAGQSPNMCLGGAFGVCPLPYSDTRNQAVADALNVRFDIAAGAYANRTGGVVAPAINVRKGYVPGQNGNWCAAAPATGAQAAQVMGLQRDRCYTSSGGCNASGVGNGDWDEQRYEALNWQASASPPTTPANGAANSRYQTYLNEISGGYTSVASPGGEPGAPQCNRSPYAGVPADARRIVTVAVVDCQGAVGGVLTSGAAPLPVLAFADLFLTEPADPSTGEIWGELVRVAQPGSENPSPALIHDTVVMGK